MIEARLRLPRRDFMLDVDLRLPGQGVTALFGPSGCGKTSVLRALAGLERAAGRISVGGAVWQDDAQRSFLPTHRRPLGYVIQEAALFPHLDVAANLAYGRRRAEAGAARVALDTVIELLGIAPLLRALPATLSGGERQRVAIARALATGPRLLLLDEPLAALDAARKAEILPYLERLHRSLALPVVLVTHALDEAARLADHLVLMDRGRVLAQGPLAELLARTDLPLARLDEAGSVLHARVAEHDHAYGLTRIRFAGGTLWLGECALAPGEPVRARVLARDVSVSRVRPAHTSVLNVLPARLHSLQAEHSTALLRLRLGDGLENGRGEGAGEGQGSDSPSAPGAAGEAGEASWLLARITRKSCEALALQPGDALFAQVKGVALMH